MAGFLDQGAVEGVRAGWLLNFVIFEETGARSGRWGCRPPPPPGGPLPLVAGFLDQGAVEGVQAGWLLNFVIFGHLDPSRAAGPLSGGPLPLVAGFLDQGAVEGVQAGWLIFGAVVSNHSRRLLRA